MFYSDKSPSRNSTNKCSFWAELLRNRIDSYVKQNAVFLPVLTLTVHFLCSDPLMRLLGLEGDDSSEKDNSDPRVQQLFVNINVGDAGSVRRILEANRHLVRTSLVILITDTVNRLGKPAKNCNFLAWRL